VDMNTPCRRWHRAAIRSYGPLPAKIGIPIRAARKEGIEIDHQSVAAAVPLGRCGRSSDYGGRSPSRTPRRAGRCSGPSHPSRQCPDGDPPSRASSARGRWTDLPNSRCTPQGSPRMMLRTVVMTWPRAISVTAVAFVSVACRPQAEPPTIGVLSVWSGHGRTGCCQEGHYDHGNF
jgi:hypothetical protein